MSLLFVRLKLRILFNTIRFGQGTGLILFTFVAAVASFTATMRWSSADLEDLALEVPLALTALIIGAVFSPLLLGSTDETVDTTRLALYGLPPRRLAMGMTAGALVGPGPIALAIPLLAVAWRASTPAALPVAVLAALTSVVIVMIVPKIMLSLFGALLRRRRSRDLATVASGLLVAAMAISGQIAAAIGPDIDRGQVENLALAARLIPTGWTSDAMIRSLDGLDAMALLSLAGSWILLAYVVSTWGRVLDRALSEAADSSSNEALTDHLLRNDDATGPVNPMIPILAKEWRYLRRHPRYRVQVISQAMVVLLGGAPFLTAILDGRPEAVLLGGVPGLTAGLTGANLLGPDGRALWAEAIARPSLRPILRARSLFFAGLGIIGSIMVTLAAAYTGGWIYAVPALAAGFAMSATGAGIGTITSTLAPVPYPEESNPNPFASGLSGSGCVTGIITFTGVMFGLIAAAPILVAISKATSGGIGLLAAITVIAPLYGSAVWLGATTLAGNRVDRAVPDLVETFARAT